MKILLKTANHNGASPIEAFNSVADAKKYLNEASYYADRVELSTSFSDLIEYTNKTSLQQLMSDAKIYGEGFINVYVIY